jgi:hypothetical protein
MAAPIAASAGFPYRTANSIAAAQADLSICLAMVASRQSPL